MSPFDDLIEQKVREAVVRALAEREIVEHITIAEYARRWSLSESTVRAAIRDGRLAVHRIGKRCVRIAADARIARRPSKDRTERARMILLRGGKVG